MVICVRDNKTGKVSKMNEKLAHKAVKSQTHSYVARHIWREEVRDIGKK